MAFIDYHFVWTGKFAHLALPTRALLYTITAICDRKTGEFHHSVPTMARLTGISQSATYSALKELADHKPPIISSADSQPGKPVSRTHLPTANFTIATDKGSLYTPPQDGDTPPPRGGLPLHQVEGNNNDPKQQTRTTTAADRISPALIAELSESYGAKRVLDVVVAMRSMDGEVKNANAYFRSCVARGWIPTSKKVRQKHQEELRKEAIRLQEKKDREQRERMIKEFEESDPEKIRQEMEKINAILDSD